MKSSRLIGLAFVLFAGSTLLPAQSPQVPGELTYGPGVKISPDFGSPANSLVRDPDIASVADRRDRRMKAIWISSLVAMAAATTFDSATSWHKHESNSFLASSDGTFGAKGVAIKASFGLGVLVPQILFRRHKDLRSAFAIGNFAEAGIFTGTAIHNLTLPSAQ